MTEANNFQFKFSEKLTAQVEFEIKGSCRELNLCTDNLCKPLSNCNVTGCQELGTINCELVFDPTDLNYGEIQSFFIRTLGYPDKSMIDSEANQIKIELDKVKVTDSLVVTSSGKEITVYLSQENIPLGRNKSIRIQCLDLELNQDDGLIPIIFTPCDDRKIPIICCCTGLLSGSSFNITLQTIKDDRTWAPQDVLLENPYNTSKFSLNKMINGI